MTVRVGDAVVDLELFSRFTALVSGLSGAPLTGPGLELLLPLPGTAHPVLSGPRVGVDYAGEAAGWPLRFALANCPAVTRRSLLRLAR